MLYALGADGQRSSIAPLLATHWHQQSPYNDMSPVIEDGNIKTVAGCVAIAASQIVFYWHRDNPEATSYDTPTYDYGKAPVTYSVPAGTPYNWNLIRNVYTNNEPQEERDAVALLVYVVGTSAWLNYGSSTGGQINDVINPFSSQFRLSGYYARKANYTQAEWEELIYNELAQGRPVLYSGSKNGSGHAVVIDGYDAQQQLFHFNFGYGGSGDGYYTVNDVTGMDGYCDGQSCVYGIAPQQRNIDITIEGTELLTQYTKTPLNISITNKSTLPIDGLKLYISEDNTSLADEDALAQYAGVIANDEQTTNITLYVTPAVTGSMCVLRLTDKDGNILASQSVNISPSSGIDSPFVNTGTKDDYNALNVTPVQNGLKICSEAPVAVKIYAISGVLHSEIFVNGEVEVRLPKGLYLVDGKKFIVR